MDSITLTRPDDWHLHVRDGSALAAVVPHSARQFGRAVIMPNLVPPVTAVDQALAYRERVLAAAEGSGFRPLMALYLTDSTSPEMVQAAADSEAVLGYKLYPAGATTHSDAGVSDITKAAPALAAMEALGVPLMIHGEVTDPAVDIFDRERVFIETVLAPLVERHPNLRLTLEHVTTAEAVAFVEQAPAHVGATITPQHLLYNRNALFRGGIRPHHYCLPILKRERHREALLAAATSGSRKFFLGTDSAPHPKNKKESACGCAGIYSAHAAIELYAEAFEAAGALESLEAFAAFNGADFYGLPRNADMVTLRRQEWPVPAEYPLGEERVVPLRAGETLHWRLDD